MSQKFGLDSYGGSQLDIDKKKAEKEIDEQGVDISLVSQFGNFIYVEIINDTCDPCDHGYKS